MLAKNTLMCNQFMSNEIAYTLGFVFISFLFLLFSHKKKTIHGATKMDLIQSYSKLIDIRGKSLNVCYIPQNEGKDDASSVPVILFLHGVGGQVCLFYWNIKINSFALDIDQDGAIHSSNTAF